jgi:hypothetical protein
MTEPAQLACHWCKWWRRRKRALNCKFKAGNMVDSVLELTEDMRRPAGVMGAQQSPPPPTPPPQVDRALTVALLGVGVQIGALMMRAGKIPEDLAADFSLSVDQVYLMLTGRLDIGIRSLNEIARRLGSQLQITLVAVPPPQQTPPVS